MTRYTQYIETVEKVKQKNKFSIHFLSSEHLYFFSDQYCVKFFHKVAAASEHFQPPYPFVLILGTTSIQLDPFIYITEYLRPLHHLYLNEVHNHFPQYFPKTMKLTLSRRITHYCFNEYLCK